MKHTAFEELLTSVRQAGRIRRGTLKPSRVTAFRPADVRAVRAKLGTSETQFALMIGVSVATLRNWGRAGYQTTGAGASPRGCQESKDGHRRATHRAKARSGLTVCRRPVATVIGGRA